jgi:hypothetical protein
MLSLLRNKKPPMIYPSPQPVDKIDIAPASSNIQNMDQNVTKDFGSSFVETFSQKETTDFAPLFSKVEPKCFAPLFSKVEPKGFAPLFSKVEYIHFHNASPFPVMIDTWINTTLESFRIPSSHIVLLESSVGEWNIHSMFPDRKDRKLWYQQKGLEKLTNIGTFRNKPCAKGNYAWMEYDEPFHCIYSEFKNSEVKGLITFFMRKDKI